MKNNQLVKVSAGGFAFCRWGLMLLVWAAFIFKIKELVLLSFLILLFSAVFTVRNAPLIKFWDWTFGLFVKTNTEHLHVRAMRFAHASGTVLSGISVLLLLINASLGWGFVLFFAIMKTISALGFCPASKVYVCMSNGSCCAFSKKVKQMRDKK